MDCKESVRSEGPSLVISLLTERLILAILQTLMKKKKTTNSHKNKSGKKVLSGKNSVSQTKATSQKKDKVKGSNKQAKYRDLKYSVNQHIVYPLHGVGKITAIEERTFKDQKILYYIIYLEFSDMTIMMPVAEADQRGIRPLVSKNEAMKALQVVGKDFQPVSADWKMRYQMNQELLKKGQITDVAKIVRSLYNRSRIKELPILERKLFDTALRLLIDEIAYSLKKDKAEIEELIYKKMEVKAK